MSWKENDIYNETKKEYYDEHRIKYIVDKVMDKIRKLYNKIKKRMRSK